VLSQIAGLASGAFYPVGATTNTFVATDANNNVAPCTFTVTVYDAEAPTATCQNVTLISTNPLLPTPVNGFDLLASFSDNCSPTVIITGVNPPSVICQNPTVNVFPVTLTIEDLSGNTAQCNSIVVLDGCAALDVELLSFTGYNENGKNFLDWVTVTEINTDYFILEKSLDGVNFVALDQVPAAGNSTTRLEYGSIDHNPAVGVNYYRLKVVDQDGTYEYSEIVVIEVRSDFAIQSLIPNPTNGQVQVVFSSDFSGKVDLRIQDMTGRIIIDREINAARGINNLSIDLTQFASGVYNVVLDNQHVQIRERIVKR
jgi:hypothetical protein